MRGQRLKRIDDEQNYLSHPSAGTGGSHRHRICIQGYFCMSKGIAIFLCDITGTMGQPWIEAGYDIILVDPQHPEGVTVECVDKEWGFPTITKVGHVIDHPETWRVIREAICSGGVIFVAGFPPCTDVAVCRTKNFAAKFAKDKHFQAKAALIAEQCRVVGQLSGAPWFFENPISVFSSIFGKPDHIFSPYQFTDFCHQDNYFKSTCLWVGNDFVMPEQSLEPVVEAAIGLVMRKVGRLYSDKKKLLKEHSEKFEPEEIDWINKFYPDDRIHKAPPGADRANFRSATPRGFARAVFEANHKPWIES